MANTFRKFSLLQVGESFLISFKFSSSNRLATSLALITGLSFPIFFSVISHLTETHCCPLSGTSV